MLIRRIFNNIIAEVPHACGIFLSNFVPLIVFIVGVYVYISIELMRYVDIYLYFDVLQESGPELNRRLVYLSMYSSLMVVAFLHRESGSWRSLLISMSFAVITWTVVVAICIYWIGVKPPVSIDSSLRSLIILICSYSFFMIFFYFCIWWEPRLVGVLEKTSRRFSKRRGEDLRPD